MRHTTAMAATFVQITREELEEWLDGLPGFRGEWSRKGATAGIYLLHLSDTVAVQLSSTISSRDDAMGHGDASMQLRLISRVTNQVINKKAQGQSHFKRTTGWKKTWAEGVDRMKDAYLKAASFYDVLAGITDRRAYEQEIVDLIESAPGWEKEPILADMHRRVSDGGILTEKQRVLAERLVDGLTKKSGQAVPVDETAEDPRLVRLRALWVAARKDGDDWTRDFAESVGRQLKARRPLSPKQEQIVNDKLRIYRLARRVVRNF